MLETLKTLFGKRTPAQQITKEIAVAELERLTAQSAEEFAHSVVAYNEARIKRLRKELSVYTKAAPNAQS